MTQQEQDIEAVKRAADAQSARAKNSAGDPRVISAQARAEELTKQLQEEADKITSQPTASKQLAEYKRQRREYREQMQQQDFTREEIAAALVDFDIAWHEAHECLCVAPDPDRMGPPAKCRNCSNRIGTQASMNIIKRNTEAGGGGARTHIAVNGETHQGKAHPCGACDIDDAVKAHESLGPWPDQVDVVEIEDAPWKPMPGNVVEIAVDTEYSAVNPPHYQRGPRVRMEDYDTAEFYDIQAIDVMRCIQDPRLATAFKYIWRVAFGGKSEPWDSRTPAEVDARDISSAVWYLQDYLANPPETLDKSGPGAYTPGATVSRKQEG